MSIPLATYYQLPTWQFALSTWLPPSPCTSLSLALACSLLYAVAVQRSEVVNVSFHKPSNGEAI